MRKPHSILLQKSYFWKAGQHKYCFMWLLVSLNLYHRGRQNKVVVTYKASPTTLMEKTAGWTNWKHLLSFCSTLFSPVDLREHLYAGSSICILPKNTKNISKVLLHSWVLSSCLLYQTNTNIHSSLSAINCSLWQLNQHEHRGLPSSFNQIGL